MNRIQPFASAVRPVAVYVLSALVFSGGVVLLITGAMPPDGSRIAVLRDVLPLPFAETSHLLASLTGVLLIVLARGLAWRVALARRMAVALLLSGAAFAMMRSLDWEAALALTACAAALIVFRDAFYRHADWRSFRLSPLWLAGLTLVVAASIAVGFLSFRDVAYRHELWWQIAWHDGAPRFLRAALVAGVVVGILVIDSFLNRPGQPSGKGDAVTDEIRTILAGSPDTAAQVALLADKHFLVSDDRSAFLMYGVYGRSWVTMGDPVGDRRAGRDLIWRFADMVDRQNGRAVFYALRPDFLPEYIDLGVTLVKTGEVGRVDLGSFSLEGRHKQDLRSALRRMEREGLVFEVIGKADVPAAMPALQAVSDAWLSGKSGHEKGFSLGRFEPAYMREFDCAVIRQNGEIAAFANILRGADHHELSVDLIRYRDGVSKSLMDGLFAHLILYAKEAGYRWFSLGGSPLAGLSDNALAPVWSRLGAFVYRHGDHFYKFEGLRAFKEKFDPVWTPQYVGVRGRMGLTAALFDVASLISGGAARMIRK